MGEFSVWHWLIVLAVVALLFGSAKLPQLARSLGQSARVFKAETRGLREDEEAARGGERAQQSEQPKRPLTSGDPGSSTGTSAEEAQRDAQD